MNFNLKKPCENCPFRNDIGGFLSKKRATEIIEALNNDKTFSCHKTVDYSRDDLEDKEYIPLSKESHCAGALILLKKEGTLLNNYLFRLAIGFNLLDVNKLDINSPVYDSSEDFIKAQY